MCDISFLVAIYAVRIFFYANQYLDLPLFTASCMGILEWVWLLVKLHTCQKKEAKQTIPYFNIIAREP